MKKIYTSLLIILCSGLIAFAQPTLTQTNFIPAINDTQLYYIADTNTVLDNTSGANVIFDYTQMRGYGQTQTQFFVDPTTTPNTLDFPSATFTDTTGGVPESMKYNQDFNDSLAIIGLVLNINSFGAVLARYTDDPETVMKFPFQYGDSFTDNYGGVFTSPAAPLPTNGAGTVTVTADGWGMLKLPYGLDIDSVLRVVRVETLLTDTIFIPPFPPILPIPINATQISYYKPSISKNPLLTYINAAVNGDTTTNVISQYPMNGVGINELEENTNVSIFPNPTNKNVTTLTLDLAEKSTITVTIFNALGQNIEEVFNGELQQGENKLKVRTSNLSNGLYYININIGNKTITKKLIVK